MSEDLARRALEALKAAGKTVSTAEPFPGGLIGSRLTDIPGSAAVYPGGVIVYSAFAKHRLLGLPTTLLD